MRAQRHYALETREFGLSRHSRRAFYLRQGTGGERNRGWWKPSITPAPALSGPRAGPSVSLGRPTGPRMCTRSQTTRPEALARGRNPTPRAGHSLPDSPARCGPPTRCGPPRARPLRFSGIVYLRSVSNAWASRVALWTAGRMVLSCGASSERARAARLLRGFAVAGARTEPAQGDAPQDSPRRRAIP